MRVDCSEGNRACISRRDCLIPDGKNPGASVFFSESRIGIINTGIYNSDYHTSSGQIRIPLRHLQNARGCLLEYAAAVQYRLAIACLPEQSEDFREKENMLVASEIRKTVERLKKGVNGR